MALAYRKGFVNPVPNGFVLAVSRDTVGRRFVCFMKNHRSRNSRYRNPKNRVAMWWLGVGLGAVGCVGQPPLGSKRLVADQQAVVDIAPSEWTAPVAPKPRAADGWLTEFSGGQLLALVQEAQAANPDLGAAAARVKQARADLSVATAALLPTLDGGGGASRAQRPGDQRFPGLGQRANRFNLSADVSWEPDFWGRLADQRRASAAQFRATEWDLHGAKLSLAANTVKAAVTLAEARAQVALSEKNVATRRVQLELLEKRLERGLDPESAALDVSLSRADLARAEATLTDQKRTVDQSARSLEVLLGRYPAARESGLVSLPSLKGGVPSGLPAQLLSRRPDLVAAENRLYAALNLESAARKALLPSIRLTGDKGYSSQELNNLITLQSAVWTIAGQLTQPLFQGGRLRAGIKGAQARYEEQAKVYESTALTAFQEVETALAAEGFLAEQEGQLLAAAAESERSETLALGQYGRGLADVLTLLDSRQRAYEARRTLLGVQAQRLRNRADLHLALGGGFE
jgi:outer membrane protein, multidrug efflux system